jgi:hypothetical protein
VLLYLFVWLHLAPKQHADRSTGSDECSCPQQHTSSFIFTMWQVVWASYARRQWLQCRVALEAKLSRVTLPLLQVGMHGRRALTISWQR